MSFAITFLFKEIFPSAVEFNQFIIEYGVNDLTNAGDILFSNYLFKVMYRRFCNSNIQYSTIDEFKLELASALEDNFYKFKKEKEISKLSYGLTEKDFETLNKSISNSANNPNTKLDDPEKPIDFVSSQMYNSIKSNKLLAYITAIKNMPSLGKKSIIKDTAYLFKAIQMPITFVFDE